MSSHSISLSDLKDFLLPILMFFIAFWMARWTMKKDQKAETSAEKTSAAAQAAAATAQAAEIAALRSEVHTLTKTLGEVREIVKGLVSKDTCKLLHSQAAGDYEGIDTRISEIRREVQRLQRTQEALATDLHILMGQAKLKPTKPRDETLDPST